MRQKPSTDLMQEMLENVNTDKVRSLEEWDKIVADLMDFEENMTEWENSFMDSMANLMGKRQLPTKAQRDVLKTLEEKYL